LASKIYDFCNGNRGINIMENSKVYSMLVQALRIKEEHDIVELIKNKKYEFTIEDFDNWNGGRNFFRISIYIELALYTLMTPVKIKNVEDKILGIAQEISISDSEIISSVSLRPEIKHYVDWAAVEGIETKDSILEKISKEKNILLDVATNNKKMNEVEKEYSEVHEYLNSVLNKLMLENPSRFNTTREWYNYYNANKLSSYQSRIIFLDDLYKPLITIIKNSTIEDSNYTYEPTGWQSIDKSVNIMKNDLYTVQDRIDYNQIGLRCRETIILLAQAVYIENIHHPKSFQEKISKTDSKRMLDGYIEFNFDGSSNEDKRKFLKSINDLANNLAHKSTAAKVDAELTYAATVSLINVIRIVNKYDVISFLFI
jgi:hypothetical protein